MRTATSTVRSWRWPYARPRARALGWPSILAALVLLSAMVLGCGTPEKRYEVLSFFFDGVPNPNQEEAAAALKAERSRRAGTVALVRHKPFAEDNCVACHKNQNDGPKAAFFTAVAAKGPDKDVCMDCHADVPGKYEVMHGPVAVNACGFCHSAHSSKYEALLRAPAAKLCMQCHGPTGLSQTTVGHADAESNCLECHSGHGGQRNLLKARPVALDLLPDQGSIPAAGPHTQARAIEQSAKQGGEGTP